MEGSTEAGHILMVEDNPDDLELALRALRKCNIRNRIEVVKDGAEALDYLFCTGQYEGRDKCDMPFVVLLDLKMPKVGGLEVLRRLQKDKRLRVVPVVVLTTSQEEGDLMDSYRLGANSYIRKPVEFERFIDAIEQLGIYWLELNEPPPKY